MNRYPHPDFIAASPESEGVRSSAISEMLSVIRREKRDIHSVLLWRRGKLIFEHYFAPYAESIPHSMFSCSKTFTSMLIGIAQGKVLLSIHDKVLSYFEDIKIEKINDNLRAMTLEHLLMMGSGHARDTFGPMLAAGDGDWARVFLNLPVDYTPGTHFVYNTGATYMLSAILTRVTGKTALELANEWIFREIGITGASWDTCPKGIPIGGSGLHITPRDMLRMGILILSGGRWNDREIIPADYVAAAQTKKIDNRNLDDPNQNPNWAAGYCYQMWRCAFPAFRADGMGGQYIVMLPQYDMVAVFTSALGADIGNPLDLIEKYLLPGVHSCALPDLPSEQQTLSALAHSLSQPEALPQPAEAAVFPFGKKYILPENSTGLAALTVFKDRIETFLASGGSMTVPYCWNAPRLSAAPIEVLHPWMGRAQASAAALWEEDSLYLRIGFLGEPLTFHITLTPAEEEQLRIRILSTLTGSLDALCVPEA